MVGTIGGSKVIFEESSDTPPHISANGTNNKLSSSTTGSVPVASPSAPQLRGKESKASVATSKAVNGILRKGSIPGNEIVSPPMEVKGSSDRKSSGDKERDEKSKRSRKKGEGFFVRLKGRGVRPSSVFAFHRMDAVSLSPSPRH